MGPTIFEKCNEFDRRFMANEELGSEELEYLIMNKYLPEIESVKWQDIDYHCLKATALTLRSAYNLALVSKKFQKGESNGQK